MKFLNLLPEKSLETGVKIDKDLEILDTLETGWENKSHQTFALEGKAASTHALQGDSHSCPAEFSKCAKHDAGVACVGQLSWNLDSVLLRQISIFNEF